MTNTEKRFIQAALCFFCLGSATGGFAAEYSVSAFGTLGGAISDNSIAYQRSIDDGGTLLRDSLAGVQVDAKFTEQWAATAQVVLAAAPDEDDTITPQVKWTLLSYRPTNEWLIRLGRLSLGGLLNQQNMDVGVTYDMARLPNEVYLLSSSYDFDGLSIAKIWDTGDHEITLDGSIGMQERYYRAYYNASDRPVYYSADVTGGGLVVTVSDYDQTIYRLGWHLSEIDSDEPEGILSKFNFIPLGGGLYTLGTPQYRTAVIANTFFLGARIPVGAFLLTAEATAVISRDFEAAPQTYGAYLNVSRTFGPWTPYLTYAQMWSGGVDTWKKVRGATPVPQFGISQTVIDDAASTIGVYEQQSAMFGTSYAFSPKQKVKAEVMLTHVGDRSAMFDGDIANDNVMVYSLSYNFAF